MFGGRTNCSLSVSKNSQKGKLMKIATAKSVAITYLTTDELSQRIKYDARTIRDRLKDSVLLEGRHYIKPFGGRKTLYIWENIEVDMAMASTSLAPRIPLVGGGMIHG